ncbi:MAG: DUF6236 family protein [Acetobacteraceae bacterium]|nr:DUF6236 family protein [Acetobacteraceae bacterium]
MLGTALYYPHIDIRDADWLRSAVLFWDEIQTIVPTSIQTPYQEADTKICEQEGYLRPLRCDLHQDVLEALGKRVLKLMEEPEWSRSISHGRSGGPSQQALMHADKLGHGIRSRMGRVVGIHPDKMPPELRSLFIQSGGLELLSAGKLPPYVRQMMEDFDFYQMHPEELSRELLHLRRRRPHHEEGDWVVVDGRFAEIYMSALAALLAREIDVSPLTNEESSSGVNLRCLIDDVTASGPTAARGALVSVVMEGLRVDPETPIQKLLKFRRGRRDQLAELSGKFDALRSSIEKSADGRKIESEAKRVFENEVRPALARLKNELKDQAIGSAWDGFQSAATYSAAPSVALWATGFSAPVVLGVGAFITAAGIGVKSYLGQSKARAASPYTYLLDIERKFSLPA